MRVTRHARQWPSSFRESPREQSGMDTLFRISLAGARNCDGGYGPSDLARGVLWGEGTTGTLSSRSHGLSGTRPRSREIGERSVAPRSAKSRGLLLFGRITICALRHE